MEWNKSKIFLKKMIITKLEMFYGFLSLDINWTIFMSLSIENVMLQCKMEKSLWLLEFTELLQFIIYQTNNCIDFIFKQFFSFLMSAIQVSYWYLEQIAKKYQQNKKFASLSWVLKWIFYLSKWNAAISAVCRSKSVK